MRVAGTMPVEAKSPLSMRAELTNAYNDPFMVEQGRGNIASIVIIAVSSAIVTLLVNGLLHLIF